MSERRAGDTYDLSGDFRGAHVYVKSTVEGGPPRRIPLQRPPRAEHFTDREQELAHLLAHLRPGRVVTLCGPGGIGKTALAAEAVWTLAPENEPPERFPDGIIFHSFYREPQAAVALEALARAYGEEPRPTPRDAALRALAGRQALLILDGAEDADDLRAVLDVRGGCGVLVTSRARADAVARRQDVEPLEADDAVVLLRNWGGDRAADDTAAARICQLAGYLPLAVRLAGRYLDQTGETAAEYVAWLEETPLEALDQGERRLESVDVLLERSLDQVSEGACRVLGVVGLLALAPFDRAPIATALDLSPNRLRRPLGELVSYGLLSRSGERYEVSHALVHTYARERVEPKAAEVTRLAEYYAALAWEQRERGLPGYRRLDPERSHLMRVLQLRADQGRWAEVRSLVWALEDYLDICGYWTERVRALQAGIEAARALGHRRDEGAFLGNLGLAYSDLGQVEGAIDCYERALAIAREIGDRQGEGNRLGNLANAYNALGQVEKAVYYYEQVLVIARAIGHRQMEGSALGNLGNVCSDLGHVVGAIDYYEQALAIDRDVGYRQGEGADLGNLGLAYSALGEVERAIGYYEQALAIAREIGHRQVEGAHLGNLGSAYSALGQLERAIACYEQALTIAREIGYRQGEGAFLGNLGSAYRAMGQVEGDKRHPGAIDYHRQALAIDREIGYRQGEAADLGNLGSAYRALGQVDKALECHQQALVIAREIGHRQGEANHLGNLGLAHSDLGQLESAIDCYEQALAIAREIGDRQAEGRRLGNLGLAYYRLGETKQARSAWHRADRVLQAFKEQTTSAYALAGARLGLAISDKDWHEPAARKSLLSPALSACQVALASSAAPGTVRAFIHTHVQPLLDRGVEGLKPILDRLEPAVSDGTR